MTLKSNRMIDPINDPIPKDGEVKIWRDKCSGQSFEVKKGVATEMSTHKPVDKIEFWDQRILEAKEEGDLRSSVFKTNEWSHIDGAHKNVLDQYVGCSDSVLEAGCGYGRSIDLMAPFKEYLGIDQTPGFIDLARRSRSYTFPHIDFHLGVLPGCLRCDSNNSYDWVVCISLMVMIISNLGWGKWDAIQKELLRVSKNGVLCLEYTDPEVYYLIRSN